jgi:excisionase family DNA binding protein
MPAGRESVPITTGEAAMRLGVSAHEVRRLIAAGELTATPAGRFLLVDEASVRRRGGVQIGRGRALAPGTAWAALWEASGERADWLDRATRSRLRSWLRDRSAEAIAVACRRRAERHELRALPAYRGAVITDDDVVLGGMSAAEQVGADIVTLGDHEDELYCADATLRRLTKEYGLSSAGQANLIVRVPKLADVELLRRPVMPVAVVAVDLLDSDDVRTRRAGAKLLEQAITVHVG